MAAGLKKNKISSYLLVGVHVLRTLAGFWCFQEPPLDLQVHRGGSTLESTRHLQVLSLLDRHVGGQVREATCEREGGWGGGGGLKGFCGFCNNDVNSSVTLLLLLLDPTAEPSTGC